jgi:DNA-binding CsgD family transcriptional regulator
MENLSKNLFRLLPMLYQAPGSAEKWNIFIEALTKLTGASQGLFVHHDATAKCTNLASAYNLDETFARSYEEYYQYINPYLNLPESLLPKRGTLGYLHELIPDQEVKKGEFYNDYVLPQGLTIEHAIRITPFQSPDTFTSIALHRTSDHHEPPSDNVLHLCNLLMPHLQTALQLHNRLAALQTRTQQLMQVVNDIPFGILILDTRLRPVFISNTAKQIFDHKDGLCFKKGHLVTSVPHQNLSLKKLLQTTAQTALGKSCLPGGSMRVRRPSGKRPYNLLITPLFEQIAELKETTRGIAVFVSDPEKNIDTPEICLSRLYGLTVAESRLALLLIQGHSTRDISRILNITRETLKTHLKHIFRKTDTRRQGELISLLLRGTVHLKK